MPDVAENAPDDPDEHPLEKPWYAVFEGAATAGVAGAALGWVISRVAKRRRHSAG